MKSEKEKMLAGELYNSFDARLTEERTNARLLINRLNNSSENQPEERMAATKALIPNAGSNLYIQPPFFCDYGTNIYIGEKVYFNFNCVILDVMQVTIGDETLFGPNVQIYTATHPINWKERSSGPEFAKPIVIGKNVWIGGSCVICPGVSIGDRTIIGAGSVVTKNIPADVMAAGNPCKIIRQLNPDEGSYI
jgi:maltose O-acetyltransferase